MKKCLRCGHTWASRLLKGEPKACPGCKSYSWDKK